MRHLTRAVTFAPVAAQALDDVQLWLTQPGSGRVAAARWASLLNVTEGLRRNPYLGAVDPEQSNQRRVVVAGYRVVYRVDPDTGETATAGDVLILAVFGPGQP